MTLSTYTAQVINTVLLGLISVCLIELMMLTATLFVNLVIRFVNWITQPQVVINFRPKIKINVKMPKNQSDSVLNSHLYADLMNAVLEEELAWLDSYKVVDGATTDDSEC